MPRLLRFTLQPGKLYSDAHTMKKRFTKHYVIWTSVQNRKRFRRLYQTYGRPIAIGIKATAIGPRVFRN